MNTQIKPQSETLDIDIYIDIPEVSDLTKEARKVPFVPECNLSLGDCVLCRVFDPSTMFEETLTGKIVYLEYNPSTKRVYFKLMDASGKVSALFYTSNIVTILEKV